MNDQSAKTDGDDILRIEGLSKSFGSVRAVDNLSFTVRRGEIFGFLGPNGAGKTTSIQMICGLLKCDAGRIIIDGRPMSGGRQGKKSWMGLCPQNLVIWENLTCFEQLEFTGRLYDLSPRTARQRALDMLEKLGLEEKKNKLAKTLSGGMKRRLNIALAMVHEPRLLILDEPQAGLDPQSRVLVRELIHSLKIRTTVILTTHDMDEADRLADRVAIIDYGKLLVLDTPKNLKNRIGEGDILEIAVSDGLDDKVRNSLQDLPLTIRRLAYHHGTLRFMGADIPDVLPMIIGRLREHEVKIEDMTIRKKTLEDVFIALTGRRLRE